MGYGDKVVCTCAWCGKTWETLKSKVKQCCCPEHAKAYRLAKMKETKNTDESKEKARQTRIQKWGSWNSSEIMQASVARRKEANGGSYYTDEEREAISQRNKTNRTTEERIEASKKIDKAAMIARARQTREATYGGWAPPDILDKMKATTIARHGPDATKKFVEARKATMMRRHGVEHALQIPGVAVAAQSRVDQAAKLVKMQETSLARHGYKNPMMNKNISRKSAASKEIERPEIYRQVRDIAWWEEHINVQRETLESLSKRYGISTSHLGLTAQRLGFPIPNFVGSSHVERKFGDVLRNHFDVETNTRQIIPPQEVDIFIPSLNLAIEINGIFWHSEEMGKDADYHRTKMERCREKGIELIQFWDTEISEKFDLCVSMVLAKAGKNRRIFARKTEITEVDSEEAKAFFERNHLAGYRPGKCVGTYHDGELVCAMITGKSLFRSDAIEIIRFASERGVTVVGGFTKLVSTLTGQIVSYSDNRFSTGGLYKACGFTMQAETKATPWYSKDGIKLHHRTAIIEKTHKDLTQRESARLDGWMTVWDAGQRTWILNT